MSTFRGGHKVRIQYPKRGQTEQQRRVARLMNVFIYLFTYNLFYDAFSITTII
jgi:hypothetical protein